MNATIKSLLTNRNFVLLWCAYGISATGDHLSEMAVLAKMDALSSDVDITPLQARMTFLFMLPFFVLGPVTGWVADRFPRRWVMIFADLVRAGLMFSFVVLIDYGRQLWPGWGAFLPLGAVGIFAALFSPSRQSLVPTLVYSRELVSANAMISGLGIIATMFAAALGGYLAAQGYVRTAFHLDAGTFALSALCVLLIDPRRSVSPQHSSEKREAFHRSVAAGLRYLVTHRRVAQLIAIAMIFWFSGATVRSVVPAIVKNVYHGGFQDMAQFTIWLGLGLVVGSALLSILGHAVRGDIAITWSLMGAGIGALAFAGTVFLPFSSSMAHALGAGCIFVMGVFGAGLSASYNALIQRFVPNQYRGRIYGIVSTATVGGLLLATGSLAIPHWKNLDRSAGYLLLLVAALMLCSGAATIVIRFRKSPFRPAYLFCRNMNEIVARFWWRLDRVGPCTIPRRGPAIITANHTCYADPLFVHAACNYRLVRFMIAAEYASVPVAKYFIRIARCLPVRRGVNDIAAIKNAIRGLHSGDAIGVFIQGGIRHREAAETLKNGVAMLALRTGAPVIPAHISGTRYHDNILRALLMRQNARLEFGPAVDLSEFVGQKGQEVLEAATDKIFAAIQALAPDGDETVTDA